MRLQLFTKLSLAHDYHIPVKWASWLAFYRQWKWGSKNLSHSPGTTEVESNGIEIEDLLWNLSSYVTANGFMHQTCVIFLRVLVFTKKRNNVQRGSNGTILTSPVILPRWEEESNCTTLPKWESGRSNQELSPPQKMSVWLMIFL